MMDVNLVVLCGRLAAEPELREFDSGSRTLRFLVTVRSDEPRSRIDVIPVTMWDPPDDVLEGGLAVADRVWVTGAAQRRFWDSISGRRSRLEIVAHQVSVTAPSRREGLLGGEPVP